MPPDRTKPDAGFDGNEGAGGSSASRRFETPLTNDGSAVEQTGGTEDAAPVTPITPGSRKAAPGAPTIPGDNDESGSIRLPQLNLDEKVASRAAPERKRLTLKPRVAQARLIRVPAYPKSDWVPVDADAKADAKVAKK